jgi:hypothetical protein
MRQLRAAGREFEYFGLDIAKYPGVDEAIAEGLTYVQGDWPLTAPQMEDDSFHYVFIDGNHSFDRVVQDVEAFRSKVMKAGYFVFHDVTKKIIPPVPEYWQGYGERGDWKQHVAVRPALESLGLYNGTTEFRLVREDPGEETAGGVAVFQRI